MSTKEKEIIGKIKNFFARFFRDKKLLEEGKHEGKNLIDNTEKMQLLNSVTDKRKAEKTMFDEAAESNKIVDLQKLYLQGKLKEEDMSEEDISALEKLFNEQIERTKRKNASLKKKILKVLLSNKVFVEILKKYQSGEIKKEDLTEEQVKQIQFLYNIEGERQKRMY